MEVNDIKKTFVPKINNISFDMIKDIKMVIRYTGK